MPTVDNPGGTGAQGSGLDQEVPWRFLFKLAFNHRDFFPANEQKSLIKLVIHGLQHVLAVSPQRLNTHTLGVPYRAFKPQRP